MAKFNTAQSFADGDTVTGAKLNNITSQLNIYTGVISEQTAIAATVSTADQLLIADTDNGDSGAANRVTVQKLLNDTLTNGTYTNAQLSGNLNVAQLSTLGTISSTRGTVGIFNSTTGTIQSLTSSTANITLGTIPTLTAGTTTSTAANITNGTVQTLTASTATITGGTYSGTINSTTGTIGTLNSTTGTINTATSATATVSSILTSKNVAINVNTLSTASGTQNIDFTSEGYLTHSITGNITYTVTNYAAGKSLTIRITSDATQRNLTFPAGWTFVGSKPTAIAASKQAILSVTSFGATEAETVAAYAVQS